MFWMWVVWMAVLGGLEVSAFAQTIGVRGLDAGTGADDDRSPDPVLLVALMEHAARSWRDRRTVTRDTVAADMCIDDRLAGELLEDLVRGGFLVHGETDSYVPARPPEEITAAEVLRAALERCAGEEGIERSAIAARMRAAQLADAERTRLAEPRGDCTGR
jgi:hypothetical protein